MTPSNDFLNNIPDSLLSEILKRLPAEDLLRCMCVQKSWHDLIITSDFFKLHSNHHHHGDGDGCPKYLLFHSGNYLKLLCLRYDDEQCKEFYGLELLPDAAWLGISHGLICVKNNVKNVLFGGHKEDIFLWNPLTDKLKTLPSLDLSQIHAHENNWTNLAFGYVPSINDYLVVRIAYHMNINPQDGSSNPSFLVSVFSLSTNSWKTMVKEESVNNRRFILQNFDFIESVFVNGLAFWHVHTYFVGPDTPSVSSVQYFDTLNEALGIIPCPQASHALSRTLHQLGQSLCFLAQKYYKSNTFHMWILKGSIKDGFFWEEKVSVRLPMSICSRVLGKRNNGELVFISKSEKGCGLASYNLEKNQVKDFVESWKHWSKLENDELFSEEAPAFLIEPFMGSLALLDTDRRDHGRPNYPRTGIRKLTWKFIILAISLLLYHLLCTWCFFLNLFKVISLVSGKNITLSSLLLYRE